MPLYMLLWPDSNTFVSLRLSELDRIGSLVDVEGVDLLGFMLVWKLPFWKGGCHISLLHHESTPSPTSLFSCHLIYGLH